MAGHLVRALRTPTAAIRRPHVRGGKPVPRAPPLRSIATRKITTTAVAPEPALDVPGPQVDFPVPPPSRREAIKQAKPFSDFLTDTFNRQHDYLRISITERCNLRCLYCMPEEGVPLSPPDHLLTTPEIFYISSLFVSQGVNKIRLTGGEPTVRRDILPLMRSIGSLRSKGLRELAITTNGISLHRKLDSMVESGLTGINLSLDTLDPFQFQIMTRRKGFDAVMKSIDRVLEMKRLGAPVKLKINCVVMRGMNDREIIPFVELGREKDIEVRFIEYMPFDGNKWNKKKMISYQEMLDIIRAKYPGLRQLEGHRNDTSKTWQIPGFVGKIGFITSMTHNFCGTCNRLRITSDGNLKVCLFGNTEVSLRDIVRKDNDGKPIDEEAFEAIKEVEMNRQQGLLGEGSTPGWSERERELLEVIGAAVKRKKAKHAGMGELENMKNRPMILIDEQRINHSPLMTESLSCPPSSNTAQPWRSIPQHLLQTGPSTNIAGIRYFSSSTPHRRIYRSTNTTEEAGEEAWQQQPPPAEPPTTNGEHTTIPNKLTHVNQNGTAHMVSVGAKRATRRTAVAVASVRFSRPEPARLIRANAIKKGDVLSVARIAGIMASKSTPSVIPLCHNVNITHAEVEAEIIEGPGGGRSSKEESERRKGEEQEEDEEQRVDAFEQDVDRDYASLRRETNARRWASNHISPGDACAVTDPEAYPHGGVLLTARVETVGPTGVEMDALMAANAAALTVFDMCKAVDKAMRLENSRVVLKTGGRSGDWVDAGWLYARAGVAWRKDLEGVMAWKGDLGLGAEVKKGEAVREKCFRVLTRAGVDPAKAWEMLARTRDGKRGVEALKKDEDIDAEGGNDGGETAIVEEEEKKPLGEGKNVDEGPAVQSPEAEPMVQGEQSSEKAPVSNSQLMPQSTLQSVEKKKRDATAKETYPQSAFIEGTDAPHEDSQGHNKAAEEINIPLTASLIRRMSAEDIFADDTHRNKKYGDLVKEPKTDSTKETLNEQEELDKFLAGLDAVITSGKPGKVQIERETDNSALEGQKKQKSTEEEETKQEERGRTEKEEETEDEKKDVKENRKPKRKKVHKRDPKKDYPDGKGPTLLTDIVPTPRDVRRAQKSTKPPPWEYMPEGPERIKAIRQWKRDQEWDQRMERLEALNKRAAEAEASPKFSRHWLRAQGGGHIMMRKLELAARIGKHNSKRDVLKWDPPGMSEDEEVSDDELRKSWIKFIRSQPSPEDPEPGVLDKHRKKHIEKDVKAGLKRAMGRADYNEWSLLNFIWGKRERRWKREAGLKLEEKTNWMTGLVPQKIWIPWHRRLRRWQKRRPTLRKWEPPEDVHERT